MTRSLMLKSLYAEMDGKPTPMVVDLGYTKDQAARDRGEALMAAGISSRRFVRDGHDRLLVEIGPRQKQMLLAKFPIVEGETYWRATHHWRGLRSGERIARVPK